jgi:hypothetical protein
MIKYGLPEWVKKDFITDAVPIPVYADWDYGMLIRIGYFMDKSEKNMHL